MNSIPAEQKEAAKTAGEDLLAEINSFHPGDPSCAENPRTDREALVRFARIQMIAFGRYFIEMIYQQDGSVVARLGNFSTQIVPATDAPLPTKP